MASITINTLVGSGISRTQRGLSTGTVAGTGTITIPISTVNVSRTELLITGRQFMVQLADSLGNSETVNGCDCTIALTASTITIALSTRSASSTSYRLAWEVREWA